MSGEIANTKDGTIRSVLLIPAIPVCTFGLWLVLLWVQTFDSRLHQMMLPLGALLFTTTVALTQSTTRRWPGPGFVGLMLFGLTFPMWAMQFGILTIHLGGPLGLPHGVLTGALLWFATRKWWVAVSAVLGVGLAWLCVPLLHSTLPKTIGYRHLATGGRDWIGPFIAIAWNIVVASALARWAFLVGRKRSDVASADLCQTCGYDCRGITSGVCPECGHELVSGTVV